MSLRLSAALILCGCTSTHVAAVADEASDTTTSQDDGSTTEGACAPPVHLEDCDAAADPLRAPEFACYDGVSRASFESLDTNAWRRTREFGNAFWVSQNTETVLALSTGRLPAAGDAGEVALSPGAAEDAPADNDNPDDASLPDPIGLDIEADDLIWLRFDADVPPGVRGYTARVGLLSTEYPEGIGEDGDRLVWWSQSTRFTGDLATWNGVPATTTGLATRMHEFRGGHPMLARTGFDGTTGQPCTIDGTRLPDCPVGASTGWMELRGPAAPGERLRIAVALFDAGTLDRDTVVLLDAFTWTCEGCEPGVDCGLQ